ncbi:MAG TPA: hypothetical protein VLX85_00105 [Stellaceae bacterium]|nr:hypothetical protein [Stellaceae bacterium]
MKALVAALALAFLAAIVPPAMAQTGGVTPGPGAAAAGAGTAGALGAAGGAGKGAAHGPKQKKHPAFKHIAFKHPAFKHPQKGGKSGSKKS